MSSRIERLDDGRWRVTVSHRVASVTPEMIRWFMANRTAARYRLWHHDHVAFRVVKRGRGDGDVGAIYDMAERLADGFFVRMRLVVEHADRAWFVERSTTPWAPARFGHRLVQDGDGTHVESVFEIGYALPLVGRPLNAFLRAFVFGRRRCALVARHCREEFARFSTFLPALYAAEAG